MILASFSRQRRDLWVTYPSCKICLGFASISFGQAEGRQFSSGYKCSDPIAAGDRKKEMGRVLRIMMDSHMRRPLPPDLSLAKMIDEGLRGFIVCTFDLQLQTVTGGE
jgi:hypothetical protein